METYLNGVFMSDILCRICGEVIEFPKDKNQTAHEVCVYAEDTSRMMANLDKRKHKDNTLTVLKKLASSIVGLTGKDNSTIEYRDSIIIMHDRLLKALQNEFDVYLGEDKEDVVAKKMQDQLPFFRLDMMAKSMGHTTIGKFLDISQPTVSNAKTNNHMPHKWDDYMRGAGVNPYYIRTGKGDMFVNS